MDARRSAPAPRRAAGGRRRGGPRRRRSSRRSRRPCERRGARPTAARAGRLPLPARRPGSPAAARRAAVLPSSRTSRPARPPSLPRRECCPAPHSRGRSSRLPIRGNRSPCTSPRGRARRRRRPAVAPGPSSAPTSVRTTSSAEWPVSQEPQALRPVGEVRPRLGRDRTDLRLRGRHRGPYGEELRLDGDAPLARLEVAGDDRVRGDHDPILPPPGPAVGCVSRMATLLT